MSSRSTDIIFLLGAGASVEAAIPASETMIHDVEKLLASNTTWIKYKALYYHLKSAIHYVAGLQGSFGIDVSFNIETLVNTLYELERNEEHPLYPFIAAWNSRFVGLAAPDFRNVREFRELIMRQLKKWMCPENTTAADYYSGLVSVHRHLNYPIHVFSLNYDLCVERLDRQEFHVETGFDGFGPSSLWDWERFEQLDGGPNALPQLYLYKLHGSINWKRDEEKNLFAVEQIENVEPGRMEIIFGRDFKLEAADPYLFYAYQFRRFSLTSKLIVAVGYGFADSHINKMLSQSLRRDPARRLFVVTRCTEAECGPRASEITHALDIAENQVHVESGTAKSFFQTDGLGEMLVSKLAKPDDAPF